MAVLENIIISILLGALSGWIAGKIMKSEGSLLRNIVLGIVGGILAGLIGLGANSIIGTIIASVIGACLLIWIVRLITKK